MSENAQKSGRVSPRLYLVVLVLLIALPLLGYFTSNWYVTKKKWAANCFRTPVREIEVEIRMEAEEDPLRLGAVALFIDRKRVAIPGQDVLGRGKVVFLEPLTGQRAVADAEMMGGAVALSLSPDGQRLLAGVVGGEIVLYDLVSRRTLKILHGHSGDHAQAVFSPDGRRAFSMGYDDTIRLWDLESGRELRSAKLQPEPRSVAVSPDGRHALVGDFVGNVRLWDIEEWRELRVLGRHDGWRVTSVTFSADGRRVLSGSFDSTVRLWDIAGSREIRKFSLAGRNKINITAFSPDEKRVLACGAVDVPFDRLRRGIWLWDVESGKLVGAFQLPPRQIKVPSSYFGSLREVRSITLSPNGRYLFSSGYYRPGESQPTRYEFLLWRLPDEIGFWLLGTQDE